MTAADDRPPPSTARSGPSAARLFLALALSAAFAGLAMCLFVYLVASLLRGGTEDPVAATLGAAGPIFAYLLGFALTLGFACAKCLVAFDSRGPLAWSLVGAVGGVLAGSLYAVLEGLPVEPALLLVSALLGWGQLLIARRIAGAW